jgi:metallophosphoesterase superfamily enzyme
LHDPQELPAISKIQDSFLFMAGHLHPAFRMPDNGEKLPCFARKQNMLVFPAFSDFTGRTPIDKQETDAVYIIRSGEIAKFDCR